MGTRSETAIYDGDTEICRIYRQYDGYPSGHGLDLAKLCDVTVVNGYSPGMTNATHANGMGCLAAKIIKGLKEDIGGVYMVEPGTPFDSGVDYIYVVRGKEGERPTIQCIANYGENYGGQKSLVQIPANEFSKWVEEYEKQEA